MVLTRPLPVAAAFGLLATLLGLAGAWNPSLWTDEVATLNAVSKPWPTLLDTLRHVDAVHGAYYAMVKPLADVLGPTPMALRLPSAIAAGVVAASTVALTWALSDRRTAVVAGVLIATMPAVLGGAAEARSPMFVAAAATLAGGLLMVALRREGPLWWLAYAAGLLATASLSLVALSIVAAHGLTMIWSRPPRRAWGGWAGAVVLTCVMIAPLAVIGSHQSDQISWIPDLTPTRFVGTYAAAAWFDESIVVGVLTWLAIIAAFIPVSRLSNPPSLVRLAVPWLIVPSLCLAVVTWFATPVFAPRYLAFGAPAAAMLAATGLVRLPRVPRLLLLGAIVISCSVVATQQRGQFAAESSDWKTAAARLSSQADPGEPVVFVPDGGEPRSPRRALEAYPREFTDLRDIARIRSAETSSHLWGSGRDLDASAAALLRSERSWALVSRARVENSAEVAQGLFEQDGLRATLEWSGPSTFLFRLTPRTERR
ncbi:glycosyltransferase family 39 protein [Aeromicrobium duanguangcaii]|uniref:glycosyltransferase family 39 protein n=1 Tax=Aeromicrobium duanguangcaii TaxID=2968086 RepID=UPI002016CBE0|nr:hypothetical protein [Aeromicrobium duanguangcaii]MCL3837531.1 hypothetical protein [Aeromicrobium duanguangcaii]